MAITTTTDLLSGNVFLSARVTVMIIFFLIKRSRFLVSLATFWIFLFLGRSNPYPQCFIRERSHLVLLYCTRQVLPGSDSVFEGTIWLSCCQCHVAATHGQIGDALGGHSQQTSAVSWERFSSSAERSAWQSWLEAMRGLIAVLAENQQDVQQENVLIIDLQWSNTFYQSATPEEGPKLIKLLEPGFRHSFIHSFIHCTKTGLGSCDVTETCLSTWVQGWTSTAPSQPSEVLSTGTATGHEDGPYSHGNPAPPGAWLFDGFQQGQAFKLCLFINFSCLRLPEYSAGDWSDESTLVVFELQFALVCCYQTIQTLIQAAANIKNSLRSSGPPFSPMEKQQEARKKQH